MKRRTMSIVLAAIFSSLAASAALASSAAASPVWKFEGAELTSPEMLIGGTTESSVTFPGLTTKCSLVYSMKIENVSGTGKGEVTYFPNFTCSTNSKVCTVDRAEPKSLPWSAQLKTIGLGKYLVIPSLTMEILYGGEECVLGGIAGVIKGSAGALFNQGTQSFVFTPANFTATGTELKVFGSKAEWNATLSTEAFGPHLGETLSIG